MTRRKDMRLVVWSLVLSVTFALLAMLSGCAPLARSGSVALQQTEAETQAVRREAIRAAESVKMAIGVLDETGKLLDQLPVSDAVKTRYDCAIMFAVGTSQPASARVVTACGRDIPLAANAPVTIALMAMQQATTCPGLRASIAATAAWTTPLVVMLETSDQIALRAFGASLRISVTLLSSGGVTCSL